MADTVWPPGADKDGDGVRAPLAERIARRIGERGPMPVSEYVDACLYDPDDGFYMRPGGGRAGGRSGHFLTAPEVGPLFGAVLGRALDAWWAELGRPEPFTVIDWGAGPGTLARSILAAEPGCMAAGALRLVLVELSPGQRALHPDHPLVTTAARVSDVRPHGVASGVVVANELLDNLPFDIARRARDGWEELRVAVAGDPGRGGFGLAAAPASAELVAGLPDVPAGARLPVQEAARRWVGEVHRLLGAGRIVAIDYGATTPELAERSGVPNDLPAGDPSQGDPPWGDPSAGDPPWGDPSQGDPPWGDPSAGDPPWGDPSQGDPPWGDPSAGDPPWGDPSAGDPPWGDPSAGDSWRDDLVAGDSWRDDLAAGLGWLRTHRDHDGGDRWLAAPGTCDITADVALDQVQADHRAEVCTQAEFLQTHGIDDLVAEGRATWAERAGAGDLDALKARSRAREAEALLDPAGMGAFNVLIWTTG